MAVVDLEASRTTPRDVGKALISAALPVVLVGARFEAAGSGQYSAHVARRRGSRHGALDGLVAARLKINYWNLKFRCKNAN